MRYPLIRTTIAGLLLVSAAPAFPRHASNEAVFEKTWTLVDKHYWDRSMHGVDWAAAHDRYLRRAIAAPDPRHLYAVLNEMLDLLGDSHVYATSPERVAYARQRLNSDMSAGFGFDTVQTDGIWRVGSIQKPSPAAAAGMQIGWKLLSINGQPIDVDRHFSDGDVATIALEDEFGARHVMTLRGVELPDEPDERVQRLPGNILVLAFDQFDKGDDKWIAGELADGPLPAGVILDLRNNGGGDSTVLDRIAGQFMPDKRVILRLTAKHMIEEKTSGAGPRSYEGPLAVLVGSETASAAEVLAAFLDESGRAFTIGEKTAGAATGGVDYELPDGGELSVAEFDLRTAGGRRLERNGFIPHYPVKPTLAQLRAGEDPVMQRAVALLGGAGRHAVR